MSPSNVEVPTFLRRLAFYSFPLAFILCLIQGIASRGVFVLLTIIPLAGSCIVAGGFLYRHMALLLGCPAKAFLPSNIFAAEVLLVIVYTAFLISTWVRITDNPDGLIVLGAYCTMFPMINIAIHTRFIISYCAHLSLSRPQNCSCAHCSSVMKLPQDDLDEGRESTSALLADRNDDASSNKQVDVEMGHVGPDGSIPEGR